MKSNHIIKKPTITERSLKDASKGIYTFVVDKETSKPKIKKAIEDLFDVHVVSIKTMIVKGKKRTAGKKRIAYQRPDMKKARVKLATSEKIEVFEIGQAT